MCHQSWHYLKFFEDFWGEDFFFNSLIYQKISLFCLRLSWGERVHRESQNMDQPAQKIDTKNVSFAVLTDTEVNTVNNDAVYISK